MCQVSGLRSQVSSMCDVFIYFARYILSVKVLLQWFNVRSNVLTCPPPHPPMHVKTSVWVLLEKTERCALGAMPPGALMNDHVPPPRGNVAMPPLPQLAMMNGFPWDV